MILQINNFEPQRLFGLANINACHKSFLSSQILQNIKGVTLSSRRTSSFKCGKSVEYVDISFKVILVRWSFHTLMRSFRSCFTISPFFIFEFYARIKKNQNFQFKSRTSLEMTTRFFTETKLLSNARNVLINL